MNARNEGIVHLNLYHWFLECLKQLLDYFIFKHFIAKNQFC